MREAFTVAVPATSANLGPGFDAVGLALDLFVRASVEPASAFSISYAATPHRPTNDGFTREIVRAMEKVRGTAEQPKVAIRVENAIPLGKGLGASAAGAVLGAAISAQLLDHPLPLEALARPVCELEGHPDNALPALLGGIVIAAMQDGAAPTYLRFEPPAGLRAIVAVPGIVLPTAAARALLPHAYERADAIFNVQRAALLAASLASGNLDALRVATGDRFHQPYRAPLVPGFSEMLDFERPGLLSITLSGAGPSVLALVNDAADASAIGEEMSATFASQGISSEIFILNVSSRGASIPDVAFA